MSQAATLRPSVANQDATSTADATKKHSCYVNTAQPFGSGVSSQDADEVAQTHAADDFVCKKTQVLKRVSFEGVYYNGAGPADSFNITIYADSPASTDSGTSSVISEPDDDQILCAFPDSSYRADDSSSPTKFVARLPHKAAQKCNLQGGTKYWLEVQAVMGFFDGGEWTWMTNAVQTGSAADWKDPNDVSGTGCTVYKNGRDMQSCLGSSGVPDLVFTVN